MLILQQKKRHGMNNFELLEYKYKYIFVLVIVIKVVKISIHPYISTSYASVFTVSKLVKWR